MNRRDVVLVVDDTPGTLGVLNEVLEDAGYTVLMAQSAAAAMVVVERVLPRHHPDRRGDAGDGRFRGLPADEAQPGAGGGADRLHDGPHRERGCGARVGGRWRRLRHQAAATGRGRRAHPRASDRRAADTKRAGGAGYGRPLTCSRPTPRARWSGRRLRRRHLLAGCSKAGVRSPVPGSPEWLAEPAEPVPGQIAAAVGEAPGAAIHLCRADGAGRGAVPDHGDAELDRGVPAARAPRV